MTTVTRGRRHYQHVADILKRGLDAGLDDTTITIIAVELADLYHTNNSAFNHQKWWDAIGLPIPRCHQKGPQLE